MSLFERGDLCAEPPKCCPPGLADGWTVIGFQSLPALNGLARFCGVDGFDQWNPTCICEAAVPATKQLLMLTREATGDDVLFENRLRHGQAHTRSFTHPPGEPRKWLDPDGKPVD